LKKKILIFRTDRVGDLIVTCPVLLTIKEYLIDSELTIITSKKNNEYAKNLNFFNNIIQYPESGLFNKLNFLYKLRKKKFDYIFIFDGKERSFICSFFINSNYKVAISTKIKSYHHIYKIKFFKFDDKEKLYEVFQKLLNYCEINTKITNYNFISKKKDNNFSKNIPITNYVHLHLDEKWFSDIYINSYTDIKPNYEEFTNFLNKISKNENILITTGIMNFYFLDRLKDNFFIKKSDQIYVKQNMNKSIYFIYKPSIFDIESLMKNTKILIVCHGSLTHIANHFDIKKIDIIEENKIRFYESYTYYIKNYNYIFRKNFTELKNNLLTFFKE
jgi:hypothetical protein|tara:strand:+ start:294 stop:1286 length:993 start_codon:yes stop_codon:yes gene_type:complete